VQASIYQYRIDGTKLLVNDLGDPQLAFTNATKVFPDAGFGIYYQYKNYFNVGISVPNLVALDVNYQSSTTDIKIRKIPHLYFVAAGSYELATNRIWIEPVLSLRWVNNAPFQAVAGVRLSFIKWFWVGFNYRTMNAMNMEAGVTIKDRLRIGYLMDFILEAYRPDVGLTHEVGVQVFFNKKVVKGYFPKLN
jgi:type IX secretion system PorP/SprF family membrane protein